MVCGGLQHREIFALARTWFYPSSGFRVRGCKFRVTHPYAVTASFMREDSEVNGRPGIKLAPFH